MQNCVFSFIDQQDVVFIVAIKLYLLLALIIMATKGIGGELLFCYIIASTSQSTSSRIMYIVKHCVITEVVNIVLGNRMNSS